MYRRCKHGCTHKRNCRLCCLDSLKTGKGCKGYKYCDHLEIKCKCKTCLAEKELWITPTSVVGDDVNYPDFDIEYGDIIDPSGLQTVSQEPLVPAPEPVQPSPRVLRQRTPAVVPAAKPAKKAVKVKTSRKRLPYNIVRQSKHCKKRHTRNAKDCIYACAVCNPCECGAMSRNSCRPCKAVRSRRMAELNARGPGA